MIQSQHPDKLRLAQYINFELCEADQMAVLQHLQRCLSCKELLRMYKEMGDPDRTLPTEPEEVRRYTYFVLDLLKET